MTSSPQVRQQSHQSIQGRQDQASDLDAAQASDLHDADTQGLSSAHTPDLQVRGVTVEFVDTTRPTNKPRPSNTQGPERATDPAVTPTRASSARHAATFAAVDHVDLDVAPGEIVALLGPSGCGKSTLLRTIAGLEVPTSGTVTWQGADLAQVAVHKRGFGLMFQEGQLFAHKSVAGNVEYGLKILGLNKAARARRVAELLALVGLPGAQSRSVSTMSGGERQRVALARALAPKPQLLLLDEPLSALDRELRERLAVDLRAILKTTGTGAVFVTHDQDEAFAVADRVAIMRRGKLLQIDTPQNLWNHPDSREVAEFLGFEAFSAGPPMRSYAPGHFEVVEVMHGAEPRRSENEARCDEKEPRRNEKEARRNENRDNENRDNENRDNEVRRNETSSPAPQYLYGSVEQVLFRSGRTLARVAVLGLGVLTCTVNVPEVTPGQRVILQPGTMARK